VRDPQAAIDLLGRLQDATSGSISAFELLPRIGIEFVLAHTPQTSDPLTAPSQWYVLAEASGGRHAGLKEGMQDALGLASEAGLVTDAVLAANEAQRSALWRLRESMSEAQKPEGGSIKHDVSVPIGAVPDFLAEASAAVLRRTPGARIVAFGHIGDGNIHFNVSQPVGADKAAFLTDWEAMNEVVHAIVERYQGSFSAEHGIGQLKRALLARKKDPTALDVMRRLKAALDPDGLLNPGKLL